MAVKDILRVLYEPHKVFKDIIKDPSYLGPMILLIIFVLAQIAGSYVVASRSYVEQTMPTGDLGDDWTTNFQDWTSTPGVNISNNTVDFINSSLYYGPSSIEFEGSNLDLIVMELASFGDSVNCGPEGFSNVSLRLKIISPDYNPTSARMTLYSLDDSSFVYDLSDEIENDLGEWTNLTLPVGFGDWTSSGNEAVWENITGIKLEFSWSINSTINILVDGLFFRGDFRGPIELFGISYFASTAINAVAPFLFQWLLLTGFMYLLIKALKKEALWRTLMVTVGYSLIMLVIQGIFLVVVYSYLPDVFYSLEVLAGTPGEFEVAYQVILDKISFVSNIGTAIQLVIYGWIIGLGVFITRAITELGWMKSLLVSGASLLLTIIILGFLL
ncbi:MAG: hypothetical protein ACXACA_05490 [Candidatus Ranarchaeia archaeon]